MKLMRIIQCGRQTVRVILPDGHVTQLLLPATVADLLRLHPHHYVSRATLRKDSTATAADGGGEKKGGYILAPEAQLESGAVYLLSPLPRLFPSSTAAPPPPPCPCSCFARISEAEDETAAVVVKCGPSIWVGKRPWGFSVSKIAPEWIGTPLSLRDAASSGGGGGSKVAQSGGAAAKRSRLWEPSLEIILENDDDDDNGAVEDDGETPSMSSRNGFVRRIKDKKTRERRQI